MATVDQIRAAARGYAAADEAAAKRLRDAQGLVFGQAAQQVQSTRQAQAAAPQLVQQSSERDLQSAEQAAQTQVQAGELANAAEQQDAQTKLDAQATAQGLAQSQAGTAQGLAEAQAEATQRVQMTQDEQAAANRLSTAGLAYDNQLAFMSRRQRDDLAKLGRDVKDQLFTSRLAFDQDELGRKFSNERQLADYTVATAKSQEELKDKVQQVQQAQQRKEALVARSYDLLIQKLDRDFKRAEQEKDQASKVRINEALIALKKDQADRQRKAGAMTATLQGGVSGAAAGAPFFPPWGAIVGGVVGAGAGYYASQQG